MSAHHAVYITLTQDTYAPLRAEADRRSISTGQLAQQVLTKVAANLAGSAPDPKPVPPKPEPKVVLSARVNADVLESFKTLADASGVSIGEYITTLLRQQANESHRGQQS